MCGFLVFIFALAESPFTGQDASRGLVVVLRRLKVSRGTIKADDFRTVIAKAVAVFCFLKFANNGVLYVVGLFASSCITCVL
jgi:hypothetical protein